MYQNESFDDFLSTEQLNEDLNQKPFQFRDDKESEDATKDWLVQNFDALEKAALSRIITYRRYQSLYKGIHWRMYEQRDNNREIEITDRKPRHVVNFVREMVDGRVSKMSNVRPGVVCIPNNDEQEDINNAKACKLLLDHRSQEMSLEVLHNLAEQVKFTFGHVFQHVYWDPSAGPIHPKYEQYVKAGKKVPVMDESGKVVKGKYIEDDIHVGDVVVCNYGPDRIYPEAGKSSWEKTDYLHQVDWVNIEELKAKYPKKASEIRENKREYYDFELDDFSKPVNMVCVRTFWHKKTKWLPKGAKIVYTDDVILENMGLGYDHGELPFIPDTDMDIYNEFWGRSFISQIESMQRFYNSLQSGIARDYGMASAPKWLVPKGSTNLKSLNNELTVVEYKGPVAPKLQSHTPTSNQLFEVQDRLEAKISKQSQIYDISRGNVPTGVTANSALRFLDEQESQMLINLEQKRKRRILKVYRMMISVMGQYYDNSDGRVSRILGRYNDYLIQSFKKVNFKGIYDVRLQNSPMLPDTKTGRISAIIDLNTATQTDPIFRKEQVIEMLDLATDEAFRDKATVAVTAARTVLEMILNGEEPPAPQPSDDFLVYYAVFSKALQETVYKTKANPEVRGVMEVYVTAMEMLMFERATKNLKFLQELMNTDNYPMFFTPAIPLPQLAMQLSGAAMPNATAGGANTSKVEELPKMNSEVQV